MNGTISLLSTLILASVLFWTSTDLAADELVVKEAATLDFHCHLQFPPSYRAGLYWEHAVYDEAAGSVSDFYGSCDHDTSAGEEFRNILSKKNLPQD